jgi:hypothetical protein
MSYDASTGTMMFEVALVDLRRGGSVRRRSWSASLALDLVDGKLIFRSGDRRWTAILSNSDILADDWDVAL